MNEQSVSKSIAIIGGGPSGLLMFKRLIESGQKNIRIHIFEAKGFLGGGMPYSHSGAGTEHITNVSGNEIPNLILPLSKWVSGLSRESLKKYDLDKENFTDYKVLPRLLFGEYLNTQFELLKDHAKNRGILFDIHLDSVVTDISDLAEINKVTITVNHEKNFLVDSVIICTGHEWPLTHEKTIPRYYDSPYPPDKLKFLADHPVAIRGSSLTAIDAVRTIARRHGHFIEEQPHRISFQPDIGTANFKIILHSRHGLLPAIRFHLEDPKLSKKSLLTKEQIIEHRRENKGFLSLDFIFEKDFKDLLAKNDPAFYDKIRTFNVEEFVDFIMKEREQIEPFDLFKKEYREADRSIKNKRSIYWKELLATLSFAMNYPAKHFSAEDSLRLQRTLMPLIAVVIAFVPQSSCEELIALYDAGRLELVTVGEESEVKPQAEGGITYCVINESGKLVETRFKTFVDCIGQRHLSLEDFPFQTLVKSETIVQARIKFRSSEQAKAQIEKGNNNVQLEEDNSYYLKVPGIAIDDNFRVIGKDKNGNPRIHMMAVPFIGGFNPDYSGLDFCEEASKIIIDDLLSIGL